MPAELLTNQYGFRPTGSTTAALIYLFHSIIKMLESCPYVRALLIDFTKAFDIVDHTVIMSKLGKLQLPGNIYRIVLAVDRRSCVKMQKITSGRLAHDLPLVIIQTSEPDRRSICNEVRNY